MSQSGTATGSGTFNVGTAPGAVSLGVFTNNGPSPVAISCGISSVGVGVGQTGIGVIPASQQVTAQGVGANAQLPQSVTYLIGVLS